MACASPKIVVSIKPVHSLVSALMEGISEPGLLVRAVQSPHTFNLKPSDRKLLADADLIIWVGPGLEKFMPKLLQSLNPAPDSLALIETTGLTLLPLRHTEPEDEITDTGKDSHIWLSTHNADRLVDEIYQSLVRIDPDNETRYSKNKAVVHLRIQRLRDTISSSLKNSSQPFLTYHDAYQYFENEFHLNSQGFIVSNHDRRPGARRILQVEKIISQNNIRCLFYEAPSRPSIVDTLQNSSKVKAIELDPAGLRQLAGPDAWFNLMKALGDEFKHCLQPG